MASLMTRSQSTSTYEAIPGVSTSAKSNFEFKYQPQDDDIKQLKSASPVTEQTTLILPPESAVTKKSDCYFLDWLPRELCDKVYDHLLVFSGHVIIGERLGDCAPGATTCTLVVCHDDYRYPYPGQPSIAATCRQVYREVIEVFYGRNTFVSTMSLDFYSLRPLSRWLARLGKLEKECVRKVNVRFSPTFSCKERVTKEILRLCELHWPDEEDVRESLEEDSVFDGVARIVDREVVDAWLTRLNEIQDFDLRKIVVNPVRDGTFFDRFAEAWAKDAEECVAAVMEGRESVLKWVR